MALGLAVSSFIFNMVLFDDVGHGRFFVQTLGYNSVPLGIGLHTKQRETDIGVSIFAGWQGCNTFRHRCILRRVINAFTTSLTRGIQA